MVVQRSRTDAQTLNDGVPLGFKVFKFPSAYHSYYEAMSVCEANSMTLPEPKDEETNKLLDQLKAGMIYLGMTKYSVGGPRGDSPARWWWRDGTPVSYFPWQTGWRYGREPDNPTKEKCAVQLGKFAVINGGQSEKWADWDCVKTHPDVHNVVCQDIPGVKEKRVCQGETMDLNCGGKRIGIQSAMYGRTQQRVCGGKQSWYNWCKGGSHVLDKVKAKCQDMPFCRLQANNEEFRNPCFGISKYLHVHYVCREPTLVVHRGCPSGFEKKGRFCYRLVEEGHIYIEATKLCESMGGYLAEPLTRDEDIAIAEVMYQRYKNQFNQAVYLGGLQLENGAWIWPHSEQPLDVSTLEFPPRLPDDTEKHWCMGAPGYTSEPIRPVITCDNSIPFICQALAKDNYKDDVTCPIGFTMQGDDPVCLLYVKEKKNWSEAQSFCKSKGSHVAEPRDAKTARDIGDFIAEKGIRVILWMGGTDSATEGDWLWQSDQQPVTWSTAQPGNSTDENCMSFWNKTLGDRSCSKRTSFLCRSQVLRFCPVGFERYGSKYCYKRLLTQNNFNWASAQAACKRLRSYLAEPRTSQEQYAVQEVLAGGEPGRWNGAWLGARLVPCTGNVEYSAVMTSGCMKGRIRNVGRWSSTNHYPLSWTWTYWGIGQPTGGLTSDQHCVVTGEKYWWDSRCSRRFPAICQWDSCPAGFELYGATVNDPSICLKSVQEYKTWHQAKSDCQAVGGVLAEPRSWVLNNLISSLRKDPANVPIWLGGKLQPATLWQWMSDNSTIEQYNSSNSTIKYGWWRIGGPTGTDQNCMIMGPGKPQWAPYNCLRLAYFICQYSIRSDSCPDGFDRHGSTCYRFVQENKTMEQAKSDCVTLGGVLAEPRNRELDDLVSSLRKDPHVPLWLGGKLHPARVWQWTRDNKTIIYNRWRISGGPDDRVDQNCLVMKQQSSLWAPRDCSGLAHFFCQYSIPPVMPSRKREIAQNIENSSASMHVKSYIMSTSLVVAFVIYNVFHMYMD